MTEVISFLTVAMFFTILGMALERKLGSRKEILSVCKEQSQAIKLAKSRIEKNGRELCSIYKQIPMLPVSPETMEAATDVLTQFCITFHEQIDIANHGPKPKTLEFRNVDGTVKLVRVATGKEWQPDPA